MKKKLINYIGLLGVISLISYAAAVIFAPLAYPGYDRLSMAVSDLSAGTFKNVVEPPFGALYAVRNCLLYCVLYCCGKAAKQIYPYGDISFCADEFYQCGGIYHVSAFGSGKCFGLSKRNAHRNYRCGSAAFNSIACIDYLRWAY